MTNTLLSEIKQSSLEARKSAIGKPDGSAESVKAKSMTLLMSNLQTVMKEAQLETLDDAAVIAVVKKSLKTVDDALNKGAAGEYAAKLEIERQVLDAFVPKQLSEVEIRKEINDFKSANGGLQMKDTGAVMKTLNEKYPGQVNGKVVSDLVKEMAN